MSADVNEPKQLKLLISTAEHRKRNSNFIDLFASMKARRVHM